jgi:Zn-dependent peptidase ImmA (M78 family)
MTMPRPAPWTLPNGALPNIAAIKQAANDLLAVHGVDDIPVGIIGIAKKENIVVQIAKFQDSYTHLTCIADCSGETIVVNKDKPSGERAFSIAHCLGHLVLGHNLCEENTQYHLFSYDSIKSETKRTEQEANIFATHILVPDQALTALLREFPFASDDDCAVICNAPIEIIKLKKFSLRCD